MDRMTTFKEAVKTALAMALVYGIALKVSWMNPYWAAFAVAWISLPTAGQSLHKGVLRMAGTFPGCIAGLVIISLAPQSRWLFMLLASGWIFFTTYMMLIRKSNYYFWFVAGFVCLVIILSGPSSQNTFEHAMYRTLETAMGIVVYTLISVFIWPRSNARAIKKTSGELTVTQMSLFRAGRNAITARNIAENFRELRTQEVKQLNQLAQALQAEGSESYEVYEVRHLWEQHRALSTALMETFDRWQTSFIELVQVDLNTVLVNLPAFLNEIENRFKNIQLVLAGSSSANEPCAVPLTIDHTGFHVLPSIDRAAFAVTKKELENLDILTASILNCVRDISGENVPARQLEQIILPAAKNRGLRLPVPDLDNLTGATFAAATLAAGFMIWIFLDPPGHQGWLMLPPIFAMLISRVPQARVSKLVKPIAVAFALAFCIYVFIMPKLSTYVGLGSMLFLITFIFRFFFSGFAQAAGMLAMINFLPIQNHQTYNFAVQANSYIYTILAFMLLIAMTYMLRSTRPEKAVLHLLGRFFRSTEFLISRMAFTSRGALTFLEHWKALFYLHELKTMPDKLAAWGKAIDYTRFPNNTPEQVQDLTLSLQTFVYRFEELLEAGGVRQAASLAREMNEDIRDWRSSIAIIFCTWSENPANVSATDLQERLKTWLTVLEKRIDETIVKTDTGTLNEKDGENFYRLLGGVRGVSEATVAYAGIAGTIDWAHWREEVFS